MLATRKLLYVIEREAVECHFDVYTIYASTPHLPTL